MPLPKVNQTYVIRNEKGAVLGRYRILAPHPDGGYIVETQLFMGGVKQPYLVHTQPIFQLECFELENDVCTHSGPLLEYYESDKDHPTYWECAQCHDRFPIIGDTAYWFPMVKPRSLIAQEFIPWPREK